VGRLVSLSVAAIQPPSAIYREEQRFAWWVYLLLGLMMVMAWALFEGRGVFGQPVLGHRPQQLFIGLAVGMTIPIILVVGVLRMITLVTPTEVRVSFGFIPTYRRSIPIGTIARVEVVQYRPIADCGGWGIRVGRDGERVLNARGNRGVRLFLVDGSKILIGSQRPEELAIAVEGAVRPGR
jgi:hypothetical protein